MENIVLTLNCTGLYWIEQNKCQFSWTFNNKEQKNFITNWSKQINELRINAVNFVGQKSNYLKVNWRKNMNHCVDNFATKKYYINMSCIDFQLFSHRGLKVSKFLQSPASKVEYAHYLLCNIKRLLTKCVHLDAESLTEFCSLCSNQDKVEVYMRGNKTGLIEFDHWDFYS